MEGSFYTRRVFHITYPTSYILEKLSYAIFNY